jgi:hypothetical protein
MKAEDANKTVSKSDHRRICHLRPPNATAGPGVPSTHISRATSTPAAAAVIPAVLAAAVALHFSPLGRRQLLLLLPPLPPPFVLHLLS